MQLVPFTHILRVKCEGTVAISRHFEIVVHIYSIAEWTDKYVRRYVIPTYIHGSCESNSVKHYMQVCCLTYA